MEEKRSLKYQNESEKQRSQIGKRKKTSEKSLKVEKKTEYGKIKKKRSLYQKKMIGMAIAFCVV